MNKVWIGLILGGILGALDGLSAWFYPEVREQLWKIIVPASTFKGVVAGLVTGAIARKLRNLPAGMLLGALIAALVTMPFAIGKDPTTGKSYFLEIMIPGTICGLIVGFATQRYGVGAPPKSEPQPSAVR